MATLNWTPVVNSLLFKLQQSGFTLLATNDGMGWERNCSGWSNLQNRKFTSEMVTSVDESTVAVMKDGRTAKLYLVLGNEPSEIVCDYTDWEDLERVVWAHSEGWDGVKCPVVKE